MARPALHCAMRALGIGPDDEVIVPTITFAASANAVVYQGGTPIFADVDDQTLLLDINSVEEHLSQRTKAIVAVDYAGHPCDYERLRQVAAAHNLPLVVDACHALGGSYRGQPVGSLGDLNVFSFHPVKHMTTGEGGMVTTDNEDFACAVRQFRNHGISRDHHQRHRECSWEYSICELGYNYRISDIQCALGLSQLRRLPDFLAARRRIARSYDEAFAADPIIHPLDTAQDVEHAYHLYVVRIRPQANGVTRRSVFEFMRAEGIGVNVHYIPVHLQPYYQKNHGTRPGMCATAERAYEEILSLPIFPQMTEDEVKRVIERLRAATQAAAPMRKSA